MQAAVACFMVVVSLGGGCAQTARGDLGSCAETLEHDARRSALLGASRMGPVYVEGELHGQRLLKLDIGGPLARAGLEPGDTIIRVDGTRIGGSAASAYLWCKLGSGEALEFEVERSPGGRVRVRIDPAS